MTATPTLLGHWQRTVASAPEAPALFDAATGRTWTRRELAELGADWGREYCEAVRRRSVIFAEPNGPEWWRVFLGLLASGATVVALDPGEPAEAQRAAAKIAGADWLWRDGKLEPSAPAIARAHRRRAAAPFRFGRKSPNR